MTCVLDASALLALLLGESRGETVRAELPDASISTVNLAEVVAHYARNGATEDEIREILDPLPLDRIDFDTDLAVACGLMPPATRAAGLSLGDRACLALAKQLGVRAVTADRAWSTVAEVIDVSVEILR